MKGKIGSAVILILTATYVVALRCYVSGPPDNKEADCEGSCTEGGFSIGIGKASVFACSRSKHDDSCYTFLGAELCACNSDLCNNGTLRSGGSGMVAKADALKISCIVAMFGIITKLCLL